MTSRRKIPLLVLALAAAGCGSSQDGAREPALAEGTYAFALTGAPVDTCWPADSSWPPLIETEVTVETPSADAFRLVPPHVTQWLLPVMEGLRADRSLGAVGDVLVPYDAACSLRTTASLAGEVTGNDSFAARIDVVFDAGVSDESGVPADCSALAGTTVSYLVPFPVLNDPATGSCQVSILVDGHLTEGL